jgi:hypothetical protein
VPILLWGDRIAATEVSVSRLAISPVEGLAEVVGFGRCPSAA